MRILLALLAVCVSVAACDSRPGGPTTTLFPAELGTYTLRSMSGTPLPITLTPKAPNTTRKLVADTLVITSGANMREVYYVATRMGPDTASDSVVVSSVATTGKYTITRDSIGVPADFPYLYGRYAGGTILFTDADGFVWEFRKQ